MSKQLFDLQALPGKTIVGFKKTEIQGEYDTFEQILLAFDDDSFIVFESSQSQSYYSEINVSTAPMVLVGKETFGFNQRES